MRVGGSRVPARRLGLTARLLGGLLLVGVLPLGASAEAFRFSDTFDTGLNGWQTAVESLAYDPLVGGGSAKLDNNRDKMYYNFARELSGRIAFSVQLYDDLADDATTKEKKVRKAAAGLMAHAGGDVTAGGEVERQLAIGLCESVNYQARITLGMTNTVLDTGVARSRGWHRFMIEVTDLDTVADIVFYVDGQARARHTEHPKCTYDAAFLGLGLSGGSTGDNVWFDNLSVHEVPEPGGIALATSGLAFAAVLLARRRRGE